MNKWIERSITALAIATVVGIVCYQFVYGLDNRIYNLGFNARKNDGLLDSVNNDGTCNMATVDQRLVDETNCHQGYIDSHNAFCHIGVAKSGSEGSIRSGHIQTLTTR
jgi:hypothetical protein